MWSFCGLIPSVLVLGLGYLGISLFNKRRKRVMLDSWTKKSHESKDVVILHGLPRAYTVPTGSPFVLKLETYLRMANIPYTYDTTNSFGENGKCPWISLNGKHISDSQLIIDFLGKKFEKNFSTNYSKEQLALGTAVRVMTEEHLFWSLPLWMFAWEGRKTITSALPIPKFVIPYIKYKVEQGTWGHGIGRHSEAEIHQLMRKDIESISIILGNKPFLLGDEPCEDDCALFGLMAQFVWGGGARSPESRLLLEKYQNIPEYCIRMKERFWPDWNQMLAKAN